MSKWTKKILVCTSAWLSLLMLFQNNLKAQVVISQVQRWQESVDAADLTIPDEAGVDLTSTVETAINFNQLDIKNVAATQGWKITVSRQDINWPGALTPSIKRTSNGNPCPTCMGVNTGLSQNGYLAITAFEQDFIFGTGEVGSIELQFRIDGLSLLIPADDYQTEIIYTLYGD